MPSSIQVPEVGELDRKYCDHLRSLRAAIESRLSSSPDQLRAFRATPNDCRPETQLFYSNYLRELDKAGTVK